MWWHTVVFPAIGRLGKVDLQFEASLGYTVKKTGQRKKGRRGEEENEERERKGETHLQASPVGSPLPAFLV